MTSTTMMTLRRILNFNLRKIIQIMLPHLGPAGKEIVIAAVMPHLYRAKSARNVSENLIKRTV